MEEGRDRQRREALLRANEVRCARAELKRDLKRGVSELDARELLADPPALLCSMELQEFLRSLPRVGRVKAHRFARQLSVSPTVPLGRLSPSTRQKLADWLP